jgi:hypothetical protein
MDVRSKQQSSSPWARFETAPPGWLWRRATSTRESKESLAASHYSFAFFDTKRTVSRLRRPWCDCRYECARGKVYESNVRSTAGQPYAPFPYLILLPILPIRPCAQSSALTSVRSLPESGGVSSGAEGSFKNPRRSKKVMKKREKADA